MLAGYASATECVATPSAKFDGGHVIGPEDGARYDERRYGHADLVRELTSVMRHL
ncbi:hypothetical protein ACGF0J_08005 [Nonomuraea sp. NPDC047897]|uniref:hypothetical protein n=1 Tax=Nonomuraea sp. NPDC047897 TaxID=3364346 RepID=UPI003716A9B4